ncbi:MAG: sodium:solute symporter family protein [Cytophagales bacterium]|nr:sodium:solute symporter family protein [Bernardetiaceae bacterium]MDW8206059.1 sodium:solute symporter family protein [Cytophagales bacterium]
MLLAFVVIYLLATILIGYWASRRVSTTEDFLVAGKQLPMFVTAAALFATWFGSETLMGASSKFIEKGAIGVVEDPLGAALCFFMVGLFYARPLYKLNILTINDFFKIRFGRKAELISAILMVPSYFGWIAAQLVALALLLHTLTGLPTAAGVWLAMAVVLFYTYIGGMWAVSITDFVQTLIIIVGLFFLMSRLWTAVGGWKAIEQHTPPGFFSIVPKLSWEGITHYVAAWITLGLGSIPSQDLFQRIVSSKSARAAVNASFLSGMMYLSVGTMPLVIGLCGAILYPDIMKGDTQLALPTMVMHHADLWLQILFMGALLSAILSTTSGATLAPAAVLGENILKPLFKGTALSDRQLLQLMRFSVVTVAVLSAIMANISASIYELAAMASAFTLVSLFAPLTAGLYWKKASSFGAIASMISGMVVWLFCIWMETEIPPLIYATPVSIAFMIIGSLVRVPSKYAGYFS